MINPHEFRPYWISFRAAKETVEPPGSQSYNANTSSRGQTDWRSNDEL